jgi:LSD1 subclass zinc finger protein
MARRTVFSMGGERPFIHYRELNCRHICACESVLSYPVGAQIIKCPECNTIRRINIDNEYLQMPCVACLSQILVPRYSNSINCPACTTELTIKISTLRLSQVQELDSQEEKRLASIKRPNGDEPEAVKNVIVVVENPPSHTIADGKVLEKTNKAFGFELKPAMEPPQLSNVTQLQ